MPTPSSRSPQSVVRMLRPELDSGRAGPQQTGSETSAATKIESNLTWRSDVLAGLDDLARLVDGTFVVVVQVTGGKYRRRCFLTAASAERAARRATDRGENATVYMAELKPLWKLTGGAV